MIRLGDCIHKLAYGWCHVRCDQDDDRGWHRIQQDFSPSANLHAIGDDDVNSSPALCTPQRLKFEEGGQDMLPPRIKSEDEGAADCVANKDPETDHQGGCSVQDQKVKDDSESTDSTSEKSPSQFHEFLTEEQKRILDYEPSDGDCICVNALAGCGKTTTISLLCDRLQHRGTIAYIVFNKKNEVEASSSGKFPKHVEIRTSHAFVLRHYFGPLITGKVRFMTRDEVRLDVIDVCDLQSTVGERFDGLTGQQTTRLLRLIAGYIQKTLTAYEHSADEFPTQYHVPKQAKGSVTNRTRWKDKIPPEFYVDWCKQYFDTIRSRCQRIRAGSSGKIESHDAYVKVAQLEQLMCDIPYETVMIDEAQDMTNCQADLFWGNHARAGRVIYLVGDRYQQLYRFRGASDAFSDMDGDDESKSFPLTGSFRFGERIAAAASWILQQVNGPQLVGRSNDPGIVYEDQNDSTGFTGTVVCRTNVGMMQYLLLRSPGKWCYLNTDADSRQAMPVPPNWVSRLEQFVLSVDDDGERSTCEGNGFYYKGETFTSLQDINEFVDDESDKELGRFLSLLRFLKDHNTTLTSFREKIQQSFVPCTDDQSHYDGTVLTTVHKAKGLEFDKVLVFNDFKVRRLMTTDSFPPSDEWNVLYVGLTRAKKRLYLSQEIHDLIRLVQGNCSETALPPFVAVKAGELSRLRETWTQDWNAFKNDDTRIIRATADIPWPSSPDDDVSLLLDQSMSEVEMRRFLSAIVLAYHPDKFPSHRIEGSHHVRAGIMERVRAVFEAAVAARQALPTSS